jgi:hypothetical protein
MIFGGEVEWVTSNKESVILNEARASLTAQFTITDSLLPITHFAFFLHQLTSYLRTGGRATASIKNAYSKARSRKAA